MIFIVLCCHSERSEESHLDSSVAALPQNDTIHTFVTLSEAKSLLDSSVAALPQNDIIHTFVILNEVKNLI